MAERPTGKVTFLLTDIEGSTQLWENHPVAMEAALELHDQVLRTAIEATGGYVFSTAGDAFSAAFTRADDALAAARSVQEQLGATAWPDGVLIRVRMGVHTGMAHERGGDYFGPVVNRAARIMAAGHGGQVLMSSTTAELAFQAEVVYLGEHRLKDLSEPEKIFQIERADVRFAPLRTLDATPGNLPVLATSFVGRDVEVKELSELVRAHRMVTLTGVGGVGKTRLAVQVAAELTGEFPDGVWLVELAPVGDPAAVPDAVATTLGVTANADMSVAASVARALSGRRLLVVLDNCEHVLDAAADVVETILAHAPTVTMMATSREGLRVGAEHVWPVPSLNVWGGAGSAAVELFVERARAVNPAFALEDAADAVSEICTRLDGIALAIELAAARMVSMTAQDVRDRLDYRFRLLAGPRRGLERHQTLRHAVGWSYDLLDRGEQTLLNRCSVFADGFDLAAAVHVNESLDEYDALDGLDSLVRKSLVTVAHAGGHTRYGMLETIRQFAEDQLAAAGGISDVRDRHARYFANQAVGKWEIWDGPGYGTAVEWIDTELANLRAGFRWATDQGDLDTATAIAAHASLLGQSLQRFEPVGWAEELLAEATNRDLTQLPRLYTAASLCLLSGRCDDAIVYAQTAVRLEADPRYDPFPHGLSSFREANAHHFAGRVEEALEIFRGLAARTGPAHVYGLCSETQVLATLRRDEEAIAIADESLAAARALANPYWMAFAFHAHGLAYANSEPERAMDTLNQGLAYARDYRVPYVEAHLEVSAARLAAAHGDFDHALALYDSAIDSLHRSGDIANAAYSLGSLSSSFQQFGRSEAAATLYGTIAHHNTTAFDLPLELPDRLRTVLGDDTFERCVAMGEAMEPGEAVRYARDHILNARADISTSP